MPDSGGTVTDQPNRGALFATKLRCEHLFNPLGVDIPTPRLGWIVESESRDQIQTAYHILVASDEVILSRDQGDLWDSGKVESDETIDIEYTGRALRPHERCFWKVRIWDRDARPSPWSETARWSVGISPDHWSASQWIGSDARHDTTLRDAPLDDAQWIWSADDPNPAGKITRFFSRLIKLEPEAKVRSASLCLTAIDSFTCEIKAVPAAAMRNLPNWKRPGTFDVTNLVAAGDNLLVVRVAHKSPDFVGLIAKLIVTLDTGQTLTFVSDDSWTCTDDPQRLDWRPVRVLAE